MGILSDFEDRIASGIEGVFAGAFRSPVQPVELAKALARAADDGRALGVGTVYAPTAYTIALSAADNEKLGSFKTVLAGELATYLADHAREHGYHLAARPRVSMTVHNDLRLGRFRVSAVLADVDPGADPGDQAARPAVQLPEVSAGANDMATVTVGDIAHDVVLGGDEVIVGRLAQCQVCFNDVNVSRRHAAFIRMDDGWAIADLGSTNGTTVNGRLVERARLNDGDVVEIGLTRLVYHAPRSSS